MEVRSSSEEFEPKMVASFDKDQLRKIFAWGRENNVTGDKALDRALKTVRVDEVGNIMDEKSRIRIRYGLVAISGLVRVKQNVNEILQVQMWQNTPDEDKLTVTVIVGPRGIQN